MSEAAANWRDMRDAPRDNTSIVVKFRMPGLDAAPGGPFFGHAVVVWDELEDSGWLSDADYVPMQEDLIGWLPLPDPSQAALLKEAREVIQNLRGNVKGAWGLEEHELRRLLGNTNYECVKRNLEDADELLTRLRSQEGGGG